MKIAPQLKAIVGTMQIPDGAKIKLSTWASHHPGAAYVTESTMAATELGVNHDKFFQVL